MGYVPVVPSGAIFLVIVSIFYVLAVAAISLRVRSICIIQRRYRIHDYLVFSALIFTTCYLVVSYLCVMIGGMGHHASELPVTVLTDLLKLFTASEITWLFATTVVKLSVLFLYLDLFKVQQIFRHCTYAIIVIVIMSFVAFLVKTLTICQPVALSWDPLQLGNCGRLSKAQLATDIINMIIDMAIVTLPMPVVFKLKMGQTKRLKIMGIFATGAIICLINLARLIITQVLGQADFSYNLVTTSLLACVGLEVSIVSACLPTINPIFTHRESLPLLSSRSTPPKPTWGFSRDKVTGSPQVSHPAFDSDEELDLRDQGMPRTDTMISSKHEDTFPVMSHFGGGTIMVTTGVMVHKSTGVVVTSIV